MDWRHRLVMLEIADGNMKVLPYLHQIYNMTRCDEAFAWLLKNKLRGQRFLDFVRMECDNSLLKLVAVLLKKIEKEKDLRPVFAGKDIQ